MVHKAKKIIVAKIDFPKKYGGTQFGLFSVFKAKEFDANVFGLERLEKDEKYAKSIARRWKKLGIIKKYKV